MVGTENEVKAIRYMMESTDMLRGFVRSFSGALRACMLADPGRLFGDVNYDESIWMMPKGVLHEYEDLATDSVSEILAGDSLKYGQVNILHRELFRINILVADIRCKIETLCQLRKRSVPSRKQAQVRYQKYPLEDSFRDIMMILGDMSQTIEPMMRLYADSAIEPTEHARDEEKRTDPGDAAHWSFFKELLPGVHAPGDMYEKLADVAEAYADEPEILELVRMDEAFHVFDMLLCLLLNMLDSWTSMKEIQFRTEYENSVEHCDIGWSGGIGPVQLVLRIKNNMYAVRDDLKVLFMDENTDTLSPVVFSYWADIAAHKKSR